MKKLLGIVLLALVVYLVQEPAWSTPSGSRILPNYRSERSGMLIGSNNVVKSTAGLVYSVTLYSDITNAKVNIFDMSAGPSTGNPVFEAAVATVGNTATADFSGAPLVMDNGILVTVTNGEAWVNFQ